MKQRRRTEVFNTIDEIKRDYQASSAFQYLLNQIKDKDFYIGELKSRIAELEDGLLISSYQHGNKGLKAKAMRKTVEFNNLRGEVNSLKSRLMNMQKKNNELKRQNDDYLREIIKLRNK